MHRKTLKTQITNMKEETNNKALNLKNLTKSTVWDVQENDIFRMLAAGEKDAELKELEAQLKELTAAVKAEQKAELRKYL